MYPSPRSPFFPPSPSYVLLPQANNQHLLSQSEGVHWQGDPSKPLLQRVYGVCFPEKKMLFDWEEFKFESVKRDHKVIGKVNPKILINETKKRKKEKERRKKEN
jgi:threonyl-tRNA synthetase